MHPATEPTRAEESPSSLQGPPGSKTVGDVGHRCGSCSFLQIAANTLQILSQNPTEGRRKCGQAPGRGVRWPVCYHSPCLQLIGSSTLGKPQSPSRLPFLICAKDGGAGGETILSHLSDSLLHRKLNEPVPATWVESREHMRCIVCTMVPLIAGWIPTELVFPFK